LQSRPNFFIVGAPKCGTTSLYESLRQHPQVFMPYDRQHYWLAKEPGYFCSELIARPNLAVNGQHEYLKLFAGASGQPRIGEASSLYLYSLLAAERIQRFCPTAKIIIMVREPVAMMLSWHADNLRHGHEDVLSFEQAIALEEPRWRGESLPRGAGYPACLQYRRMATFSDQIERYQQRFERQQIKVLLLEDFADDPQATLASVLEFLELPTDCQLDWGVHNPRTRLSEGDLRQHQVKNWLRKFGAVRLARRLLPVDFSSVLRVLLRPWLSHREIPVLSSPEFLAELRQQMRPEVERLAEVIDRDLSHWMLPIPGPPAGSVPSPHFIVNRPLDSGREQRTPPPQPRK